MMLPAFPLGTAYLPGEAVSLRIFEERYKMMVADLPRYENQFVTVLIASGSEVGGADKRFETGVVVDVENITPDEIGYALLGVARDVVTITAWNEVDAYSKAECSAHRLTASSTAQAASQLSELQRSFLQFLELAQSLGVVRNDITMELDLIRSLQPSDDLSETIDTTWSLLRMIPCDPISKYHMLRCRTLEDLALQGVEALQHLGDILRFRYGDTGG